MYDGREALVLWNLSEMLSYSARANNCMLLIFLTRSEACLQMESVRLLHLACCLHESLVIAARYVGYRTRHDPPWPECLINGHVLTFLRKACGFPNNLKLTITN